MAMVDDNHSSRDVINLGADGGTPASAAEPLSPDAITALRTRVEDAIRQVYDPEIPVNIYDLGLIYGIDIAPDATVKVQMTLTAPGCPVAGWLPGQVEQAIETADGVKSASVELVWDPPWDKSMMSEAAKLELGMF